MDPREYLLLLQMECGLISNHDDTELFIKEMIFPIEGEFNADKLISDIVFHLNEFMTTSSVHSTRLKDKFINKYIVKPLIKAQHESIAKRFNMVPFGILPTQNINASAIQTPRKDCIGIIDHGFLTLTTYYNQIFYEARDINNLELQSAHIWNGYKKICNCFKDGFISLSNVESSIKLSERSKVNIIIQAYLMTLFVVAHEMGHIYAGHLKNTSLGTVKHITKTGKILSADVDFFIRSREEEIQADIAATEFIFSFFKEYDLSIFKEDTIVKPFTIFCLLDLLDKGATSSNNNDTHPSAMLRLMNVLKHIHDYHNDDLTDTQRKGFVEIFGICRTLNKDELIEWFSK